MGSKLKYPEADLLIEMKLPKTATTMIHTVAVWGVDKCDLGTIGKWYYV